MMKNPRDTSHILLLFVYEKNFLDILSIHFDGQPFNIASVMMFSKKLKWGQ
jgi:hypothetical protein